MANSQTVTPDMTPDAYTNQETMLEVGDGHTLYTHDWGNQECQTPIIALHGGPGGQAKNSQREVYDPLLHRVIFYDQRGCGKSTPYGSLEHNTTQDLIDDIEKISDHFGIKKFVLSGGSWGSCLALAYGLQHPEKVAAMVLHGIFTGSAAEIDWVNKGGFQPFFPDIWDNLVESTPAAHQSDPASYHIARILGDDPVAAKESGFTFGNVEAAIMSIDDRFTPDDIDDFDIASARIENQYLSNGCFMNDDYILQHAQELTMPIWMVQGRFDMVCPPITAYHLSKIMPAAQLLWTSAGHRTDRSNFDVQRTILRQMYTTSRL